MMRPHNQTFILIRKWKEAGNFKAAGMIWKLFNMEIQNFPGIFKAYLGTVRLMQYQSIKLL